MNAGLCASCQNMRIIRSDKGSEFYQCQRSFTDKTFPKYPPLPVLACRGYDQDKKGRPSPGGLSDC